MEQINDEEIVELYIAHLMKNDEEFKKTWEGIRQSAMKKFAELVMTGKTTYHISYEDKSGV